MSCTGRNELCPFHSSSSSCEDETEIHLLEVTVTNSATFSCVAVVLFCSINALSKPHVFKENSISLKYSNGTSAPFTRICLFHHVLLLYLQRDGELVLAVSLEGATITNEDKMNFSILTHDGALISCKNTTEKHFTMWMRLLNSLNAPREVTAEQKLPKEISYTILRKECCFEDSVETEDTFRGGSLADIINCILYYSQSLESSVFDNIIESGLLLYISQRDLFNELLTILKKIWTNSSTQRNKKNKTNIKWENSIMIFLSQVCRAYRLFSSEQRMKIIEKFKELPISLEIFAAAVVSEKYDIIEIKPIHVKPQWTDRTINILEVSAKLLAEQITHFESKLHQQLDMIGMIENSGVQLNSIVTWWNQVANWTSSCILCEPTDKAKKSMLQQFLRIAEALLELRNYSSCAQIITGIKHHSVSRLRGLSEILSTRLWKRMAKLEEIIAPTNNYANYRSLPFNSPCLRFLAVHQRDIRFILDSNAAHLDSNSSIINLERIRMLGECYVKMGLDYPMKTFHYEIERNEEIQNFLSQMKTIPDDALFTLSFGSEPNRGEERNCESGKQNILRAVANPLHNSPQLRKLYDTQKKTKFPNKVLRAESDPPFSLTLDLSPITSRRNRRSDILLEESHKFQRSNSAADVSFSNQLATRRRSDRGKTDTLLHGTTLEIKERLSKRRKSTDEGIRQDIPLRENLAKKRKFSLSAKFRYSFKVSDEEKL